MDLSGSWQYIESTARSRLAHNKTKRHVSDYGGGIEIIGVAGELLVRRFLGLPEKVHEGFDGGVDINYFGMKLDVKATVLTPNIGFRYLQWPEWKKFKAEYIVMTAIDPVLKIGTLLGYATRDEMRAAPVNRDRLIACHEIPVADLHPIWELEAEALRRKMKFPARETSKKPGSGTVSVWRGLSSKMGV